jgi:DNA topoisomerase-2
MCFPIQIEPTDASGTKFDVRGHIERTDDTTLLITELPVRVWTQSYKEFLEKMMQPDEKKKTEPEIKDFMENHTDATVSFTITADKAKIDEWEKLPKGGLYAKFKLHGTLTNSNMTVFDPDSRIIKYDCPEDILKEFYTYRMDYYVKRKALLVQKLEREQRVLSNKARFVQEVCDGKLVVSNRKKIALLGDLQNRGYELFDKNEVAEDGDEDEDISTSALSKGYEYLLGMKIWSLTYEKAEELRHQLEERTKELRNLQATSPSQIWLRDLENIDKALDARDEEYAAVEAEEKQAQNKSKKAQAKKAKKAAATNKKGKKKDEWDSDLESDSEEEETDLPGDEVLVVKKSAPQRRPPAKSAAKKVNNKPIGQTLASKAAEPVNFEEPVVDEIELSLAERMARLLSPSKTAGKLSSLSTLSTSIISSEDARGTKRSSPQNEASAKAIEKPQPKRTKAAAIKKAPVKKLAPAKKVPAKKSAPQKKYDSESEDEFDFDGTESEVEVVSAPAPPRAGRTARAASKKIVYDISDDEGSDSDFE